MGWAKKAWSTVTAWPTVLIISMLAGLGIGATVGMAVGGYTVAYRLALRMFGL